jgi:hypothetical protein
VLLSEPFIFQILSIIQFFTTLTLQLQFILPEMIGGFIAHVPGVMRRLEGKIFDPDYFTKIKK